MGHIVKCGNVQYLCSILMKLNKIVAIAKYIRINVYKLLENLDVITIM